MLNFVSSTSRTWPGNPDVSIYWMDFLSLCNGDKTQQKLICKLVYDCCTSVKKNILNIVKLKPKENVDIYATFYFYSLSIINKKSLYF